MQLIETSYVLFISVERMRSWKLPEFYGRNYTVLYIDSLEVKPSSGNPSAPFWRNSLGVFPFLN